MTEIAVQHQSTGLSIVPEQTNFTSAQVTALSHIGVENASPADIEVFFHVVKRTGLDPFARQIYMIGRNSKIWDPRSKQERWITKFTIQTGIDGYRLIGRRAANAAGATIAVKPVQWAHRDGGWRDVWMGEWGTPIGARITIVRSGEDFTVTALFDEYKQTTKSGDLTQMWRQRPAGQIAKCAEALAWRMAFPQDLSGIYVDEEMQQADTHRAAPDTGHPASTTTAKDRVRAAITPHTSDSAAADETSAPSEPSPGPTAESDLPPLITRPQSKKLHVLVNELGLDRDAKLKGCSAAAGRDIGTTGELTKDEAVLVIDRLEAKVAAQSEGVIPDADVVDDQELDEANAWGQAGA